MTCLASDCFLPAIAKGFCNKHYQRWYRYGDPLAGTTPYGEPHQYYADVVLNHDGDDCLFWPYTKTSAGYGQLSIGGKMKTVSRLVCEQVHGPPPTTEHEAAHSCGNGHLACSTKKHLRWATPAENMADKIIHGTSLRGERHLKAKLKEVDVREIRRLRMLGASAASLASKFQVTERTIYQIDCRHTWGWLDDRDQINPEKGIAA